MHFQETGEQVGEGILTRLAFPKPITYAGSGSSGGKCERGGHISGR